MAFKQSVKEALGYYVYALVDPRNNRVFYVGKGAGNRVFQHAKGELPEESQSLELDTIRSILDAGKLVHCYILRHNLTEKDAESALGEFLGDKGSNMNELVTKIVSRPHQWNHPWDEGIKTTNAYIWGCPKIEPIKGENLMLVSLNKSYDQKNAIDVLYNSPKIIDSTSIYESTRKYWRVSVERAREMDYVLGVYGGIVRSVYKPFSWKEYYKPDDDATYFKTNRYGFEGVFVLDSPYLTKDVSDYPFGSGGVIRYIL